ncbi:MAG TPA: hypothetical protein VOA87_06725 [Thermoanaerobaculia bacterium]|nr:hypothetical protein [Thermoanaerobaculia bacterium]
MSRPIAPRITAALALAGLLALAAGPAAAADSKVGVTGPLSVQAAGLFTQAWYWLAGFWQSDGAAVDPNGNRSRAFLGKGRGPSGTRTVWENEGGAVDPNGGKGTGSAAPPAGSNG